MFKSTMLIVFFLSNSFNSYSNLSTRSYIDGDFSYCEKSSESKLSLIDSIFTSGIIYSEENKLKSEIVDDMVLDSILYFSNNLDSGASGLTEKDVIEYKLNGLQIKKTHQVLNSSDNWVTKTVEEKEYDPNGNLLMECEYSLDENGLPQVGGNKIGYTYNTENNVETITYYSWSFVTRWFIPSVKRTQTRGIEDNSIEILVQRYDEEREEWLNDERKFYLNIPDSIVEEIEYVWDTNIEQWRLFSSRKKTFYLQNGNLNYIDERKGYHEYTGELSSRSKSEYFSLNTPDTLYYSITTSFDFKDSVWTNGTKRVMTISETGWETDYRYSYSSLNGWIGGWQYKYKTNQESFLTTYVSHQDSIIQSENYVISGGYAEYPFYCKFKKQDSIWVGEKKQEKQFNSNNQLTEERNYTWNNELF
ncbi:MAG: hypothetical protein PF541_03445, partial [Prolixibacteraceae bacterium]|nr:hypothetical protein [Prolixibacteraceae bacterium]